MSGLPRRVPHHRHVCILQALYPRTSRTKDTVGIAQRPSIDYKVSVFSREFASSTIAKFHDILLCKSPHERVDSRAHAENVRKPKQSHEHAISPCQRSLPQSYSSTSHNPHLSPLSTEFSTFAAKFALQNAVKYDRIVEVEIYYHSKIENGTRLPCAAECLPTGTQAA